MNIIADWKISSPDPGSHPALFLDLLGYLLYIGALWWWRSPSPT
jgi:hypothetical protein